MTCSNFKIHVFVQKRRHISARLVFMLLLKLSSHQNEIVLKLQKTF